MEIPQYCDSCNGAGTYQKKCRDCDEDGIQDNRTCEVCDGTGDPQKFFATSCSECKGHGYFRVKCDHANCDNGYIEVDCHERDPHTWTLYKCPECDYEIVNRDDDESSEYALHQHTYKCTKKND